MSQRTPFFIALLGLQTAALIFTVCNHHESELNEKLRKEAEIYSPFTKRTTRKVVGRTCAPFEGHKVDVPPMISGCGVSPTVYGYDLEMRVDTGQSANGCTITFAKPFEGEPCFTVIGPNGNPIGWTESAKAIVLNKGIKPNTSYKIQISLAPVVYVDAEDGKPIDRHFKSTPGGINRIGLCAEGFWSGDDPWAIIDCNSPTESFLQVYDCSTPVVLHNTCIHASYTAERWMLEDELIAKHPHAPSLRNALISVDIPLVGLDRKGWDPCDNCEKFSAQGTGDVKDPKECYRAVVDDPREHRRWFFPCKGEPRFEPE